MLGPLEVLKDVVGRFEQAGIDYFLVGSLAAMYYGHPRFTNDIDLVVQIKTPQVIGFEKLFEIQDYYCPPWEVIADEVLQSGSFNLIHQESGIKVDIVLHKPTAFYESEFSRRRIVKYGPGFDVYIASPEDVIIKKLDYYREGGSEKHVTDIRTILLETEIDTQYLEYWVDQMGLRVQWDLVKRS